jgi:hypothetical protein
LSIHQLAVRISGFRISAFPSTARDFTSEPKQNQKSICPPLIHSNRATDRANKQRNKQQMKTKKMTNYGLSLLTAGAALYGVTSTVQAAEHPGPLG